MNRDFDMWLTTFKESIADYNYYINYNHIKEQQNYTQNYALNYC